MVFERRSSTGSELFVMLGRDFEKIFYQIVSIRMKTMSYLSRARDLNLGKNTGCFAV